MYLLTWGKGGEAILKDVSTMRFFGNWVMLWLTKAKGSWESLGLLRKRETSPGRSDMHC